MFIQIHTGVEKHNDDAKHAYVSSNKWDATGDIIKAEARIECLRKYAVAKRKYNVTYWYGGGIEADRASRQRNLLNKHVIIPVCVAVIIVMTTLSGIVEGQV